MKDYVIMPESDYQDICDAVREKTGGTVLLKSGDVATQIETLEPNGSYNTGYEAGYEQGVAEPPTQTEVVTAFSKLRPDDMSYMFYRATKVTDLDLRGFDTSAVTSMQSIFSNCWNLKSVNLSSFNTSLVTIMNSMFSNDGRIEILDLSSFDTGKVTNIAYMFNKCTNLKSLVIGKFNTSAMTAFTRPFYQCDALTNLKLEEGSLITIDLELQHSPLSKDSFCGLIPFLSDSIGKTLTLKLSAVNTAFETSSGAADGSTSSEWLALTATKPNWTFSLI